MHEMPRLGKIDKFILMNLFVHYRDKNRKLGLSNDRSQIVYALYCVRAGYDEATYASNVYEKLGNKRLYNSLQVSVTRSAKKLMALGDLDETLTQQRIKSSHRRLAFRLTITGLDVANNLSNGKRFTRMGLRNWLFR